MKRSPLYTGAALALGLTLALTLLWLLGGNLHTVRAVPITINGANASDVVEPRGRTDIPEPLTSLSRSNFHNRGTAGATISRTQP